MSFLKNKKLLKKVVFTSMSIPMLYNTIWAWDWQARRKVEKQKMVDERIHKLSQRPILISSPSEIPINSLSKEEFDKDWLYTPVKIKGIFGHDKESMVQRVVKGDRGLEIITPLYTGIDKQGRL